jgi:hypothetical protein
MKRNVTLAIDEDLVEQARLVASRRGTTMTEMVRQFLAQVVSTHDDREAARRRMMVRLRQSPLRVGDGSWTREELHERG